MGKFKKEKLSIKMMKKVLGGTDDKKKTSTTGKPGIDKQGHGTHCAGIAEG